MQKVCKKCPKELPKFCAEHFSLSRQSNIGCMFWICLWKNLNGCSDKLETWFVETLDPVWEKARKQQFYPGSRSLWICHLEYKNIFKQYLYNLDLKKYLDSVFKDYVQLVLSISFTSFLHCSLFDLQLILWQFNCRWLFQLGPKYKLKVKLYRR